MENRKKITIKRLEKDYDTYIEIWKNNKYKTNFDKALAMLRKYCHYGNLNSGFFIWDLTVELGNKTKNHADEVSRLIKDYDSIPQDSLMRTIECLLNKLARELDLRNHPINPHGDLNTILTIIQEETNINTNEYLYRNISFMTIIPKECKSWGNAFHLGCIYLPAPDKITNIIWDSIKDSDNLLKIISETNEQSACYLINNKKLPFTDENFLALYIDALKNYRPLLAYFLFEKINSLPITRYLDFYKWNDFLKQLKSTISMLQADSISSQLITTYFEHIPAAELKNKYLHSLDFFLDISRKKNVIKDWPALEKTVIDIFSPYFDLYFTAGLQNPAYDEMLEFFPEKNLVDINNKSNQHQRDIICNQVVNNILNHQSSRDSYARKILIKLSKINLIYKYCGFSVIANQQQITIKLMNEARHLKQKACDGDEIKKIKTVADKIIVQIEMAKITNRLFHFFLGSKDDNSFVIMPKDVISFLCNNFLQSIIQERTKHRIFNFFLAHKADDKSMPGNLPEKVVQQICEFGMK